MGRLTKKHSLGIRVVGDLQRQNFKCSVCVYAYLNTDLEYLTLQKELTPSFNYFPCFYKICWFCVSFGFFFQS